MDDFATGYLAGQDGGNNNSGFFGNEGLWAVIILAIIFGWGTNGYGRNGGDNGMNTYIPYLVGTGATGQGGNDTRAALSEGFYQQDTSRSLAGIQSGICSLGYDQLAQMNGVNTNIANGFAGVNSAIANKLNKASFAIVHPINPPTQFFLSNTNFTSSSISSKLVIISYHPAECPLS